jgi:hypothetical protein
MPFAAGSPRGAALAMSRCGDTLCRRATWPRRKGPASGHCDLAREAQGGTRQRRRCGLAAVAEPVPRNWWTASDVATLLGIAPSTIRVYVARGQMPAADSGPHAATICGQGCPLAW